MQRRAVSPAQAEEPAHEAVPSSSRVDGLVNTGVYQRLLSIFYCSSVLRRRLSPGAGQRRSYRTWRASFETRRAVAAGALVHRFWKPRMRRATSSHARSRQSRRAQNRGLTNPFQEDNSCVGAPRATSTGFRPGSSASARRFRIPLRQARCAAARVSRLAGVSLTSPLCTAFEPKP